MGSIEKANTLNSCYAFVWSCEQNSLQVQSTHWGEPFTISINITRKQLAVMIGRYKSTEPDGIPGTVLKLDGEAMIPYLAQLLDMTVMLLFQRTGKKSHGGTHLQGGGGEIDQ
jgi:hypothetical protein